MACLSFSYWFVHLCVSSVQSLSHVQLFVTSWTAAHQASMSFTISQSLLTSCRLNQRFHPTVSSSVAPSPFAFNLSQRQGLFQWVESSHQVAKVLDRASVSASVLPMNIHGWFILGLTDLISLQSKGLSRVFSNTTVQKYQFFGIQPPLWSNSHIHTWLLEKP